MFGLFESDEKEIKVREDAQTSFKRFSGNPILVPDSSKPWKAKAVYNPAAIFLDGKVHLIYRGQGNDGVSCFGYASSLDGTTINEDLDDPIYRPSANFELPTKHGWNSGCEDPRLTQVGDNLILTYTAYDGTNPPRVAMSSIPIRDFLAKNWVFEPPKLISPPGVDDKDCCIIENPTSGGFIAFHRLGSSIWMDKLRDLDFPEIKFLTGGIIASAREGMWDNIKIGLASPPFVTDVGLLLLYHSLSNPGFKYQIGAMILDKNNSHKIIARSEKPLLSPEENYEKEGQIPNLVFSCGAVLKDDTIFMYYGGADTVTCVATMNLQDLLDTLLRKIN